MAKKAHDWASAKTEYISDPTSSYRTIAKKYGMSLRTVGMRAKSENWPSQREKVEIATVDAIDEQLPNRLAEHRLKFAAAAHELHLANLEVLMAKDAKGKPKLKPRSLYEAASIMDMTMKIEAKALGIDQVKPEQPQVVFIFKSSEGSALPLKEIESWQ